MCRPLFLGLPLYSLLSKKPVPAEADNADSAPPAPLVVAVAANTATSAANATRTSVLLALTFAITWFISTGMAAHLPRLLQTEGVPLAAAISACSALLPVPGRMDCVAQPGQPLVAVDYAHTPDALEKALAALRPLADERQGQLWCVFGCGGDRDPGKRPLMGAIAQKNADHVVITSDNPRSESAEAIIGQILKGLHGTTAVSIEPDRAVAIASALGRAEANDVVLLAGKGHEDYQETAGMKRPFSDRHEAMSALQRRSVSQGLVEGEQK